MRRRDFVKTLMAASVTAASAVAQKPAAPPVLPHKATPAPGPVPWERGLMELKPLPITPLTADAFAQTDTQFFNPTETATLRRLCELFQPAYKHHPGAIDAGTPQFLDFLTGISPEDQQQIYRSGLARLESDAQQQFSKSFASLDPSQADKIIRPGLSTWMNDHPPAEPFEHFIATVQVDIRTATENSHAWADAAKKAGEGTPNLDLYWYPVDPDLRRQVSSGAHSDQVS
ncbi:gluconate 2-dehydrogenase subunit 3 family protein [Acidicapsa dinghuensis]|uniref:Gluconate 2-dehydrogenase subunit 3 family protein n=1 Tax=Acidicapsa dinghuensis TaxID=2218256 RepID=A0ABW1ENW1_9BACT|nr:gluconate 2-dehydrogenase subunit 3 family protein [Acidicapsa dinghuensis]